MRFLISLTIILLSQSLAAESIFFVPGENWGFQFNSPKLTSQKGNTSTTEYQFEASTDSGFIISAFVEPSSGKGNNSASCMKYYWALSSKNPTIQKNTIKFTASKPFSVVTYLTEGNYQGQKYIQANTNYYGYRAGNCIDFHISEAFFLNSKIDYTNLLEFGKSFGYYK